jgi:hypothetical protein
MYDSWEPQIGAKNSGVGRVTGVHVTLTRWLPLYSCVRSDIPTLTVFSFEARPEIARIAGILLNTYICLIDSTPFRCPISP